jgi:hypothetical protein
MWVQPLSASQLDKATSPAVVVSKVRISRLTLPSDATRTHATTGNGDFSRAHHCCPVNWRV